MTSIEKWNMIVSLVQERLPAQESEVQQLWENIFADSNLFGYSRFMKEIDSQRKIRIGSSERTIPDIIIRDSINNKDLFVVELKRHKLLFDPAYKEQLLSYMRLLQLNVGILICNKIYLYVLDYDDNKLALEFSFEQNSADGSKFIELFSKNEYHEAAVKQFIKENNKFKSHVQEIREDLQSLSIIDVIKNHYASKYSGEEIELALNDFQFSVNSNARNEKLIVATSLTQNVPTKQDYNRNYIPSSDCSGYYEEPQDIDYIIIKTSQKQVDIRNGSMYDATRYAWNINVEHARQYKYVFGVIKGIVCGVYCVDKWQLVTEGEAVGRYEFFGHNAPDEIANRFLGKRIPPQYSKPGLASPVLYKTPKHY